MGRRTSTAAAAVVLALLAAMGCEEETAPVTGSAPSTSPPAAGEPPTRLPWWQYGVLHVGDVQIPTRLRQIEHAGGTTVVGRAHWQRGSIWSLGDGDRLVSLVESDGLVEVKVSPDGSRVVWVEETRSRQTGEFSHDVDYLVTAYDVADRRVAATTEIAREVTCCDQGGVLTILDVEVDGRVLLSAAAGETGPLHWVPSREPVTVDSRGGATPYDSPGWRSPDGRRFLEAFDPVVVGPGDRQVVLGLAAGDRVLPVGWEDASHVIVRTVDGDGGAQLTTGVLRCEAATGECAEIPDAPTGRVVWPEAW